MFDWDAIREKHGPRAQDAIEAVLELVSLVGEGKFGGATKYIGGDCVMRLRLSIVQDDSTVHAPTKEDET